MNVRYVAGAVLVVFVQLSTVFATPPSSSEILNELSFNQDVSLNEDPFCDEGSVGRGNLTVGNYQKRFLIEQELAKPNIILEAASDSVTNLVNGQPVWQCRVLIKPDESKPGVDAEPWGLGFLMRVSDKKAIRESFRCLGMESIDPNMVMTIERKECFGNCPTYRAVIKADGSIVYDGFKNVKTMGRIEIRISTKELRCLINAFEEADYFSLEDDYTSIKDEKTGSTAMVADAPETITSIQTSRGFKTIHSSIGVPEALVALQNKIETCARLTELIQ